MKGKDLRSTILLFRGRKYSPKEHTCNEYTNRWPNCSSDTPPTRGRSDFLCLGKSNSAYLRCHSRPWPSIDSHAARVSSSLCCRCIGGGKQPTRCCTRVCWPSLCVRIGRTRRSKKYGASSALPERHW